MPKNITKSELAGLVESGQPCFVGEYRRGSAETINYRSKTTGRAESFDAIRHIVESEALAASITVSERAPEGFKVDSFVQDIPKGTPVVVVVTEFMTSKGSTGAKGEIRLFSPSASLPAGKSA